MPRWRGWTDTGSASLEFITAGLILLVPLVYLVVAISAVQAGALAVEGVARQAARVYVQGADEAEARDLAARAVGVGLADYGIAPGGTQVRIDCAGGPNGCLTRGSAVTVTVRIRVTLPLVPDLLALRGAASIPLEATATQTVSRFWGAG
jgi:Flp pilus assembly protein TadG